MGGSSVCWGRSRCCAPPRAAPPPRAASAEGPDPHGNRSPRPQGLQQEAKRATITFPNPARGAEPARPQLRALLGRGEPLGDIGGFWATHSPRPAPPPARPHISGCNLGKFFPFFFFFKLSLLSLLGATWWCAGGVSLPPRAPPLSLSAPSRPPLFFPPQ